MMGLLKDRLMLIMIILGIGLVVWILFFSEKKIWGAGMKTLTVTSLSFENGKKLPDGCACKSESNDTSSSPHIAWSNVPNGTKSFTIICDDPDAPHGTWVHWVIYDIPGNATEMEAGITSIHDLGNGARQGLNSWGKTGYGGACPPKGDRPHRYIFTVYALDTLLNLRSGSNKNDVLAAQQGHVLAAGQITGFYSRA